MACVYALNITELAALVYTSYAAGDIAITSYNDEQLTYVLRTNGPIVESIPNRIDSDIAATVYWEKVDRASVYSFNDVTALLDQGTVIVTHPSDTGGLRFCDVKSYTDPAGSGSESLTLSAANLATAAYSLESGFDVFYDNTVNGLTLAPSIAPTLSGQIDYQGSQVGTYFGSRFAVSQDGLKLAVYDGLNTTSNKKEIVCFKRATTDDSFAYHQTIAEPNSSYNGNGAVSLNYGSDVICMNDTWLIVPCDGIYNSAWQNFHDAYKWNGTSWVLDHTIPLYSTHGGGQDYGRRTGLSSTGVMVVFHNNYWMSWKESAGTFTEASRYYRTADQGGGFTIDEYNETIYHGESSGRVETLNCSMTTGVITDNSILMILAEFEPGDYGLISVDQDIGHIGAIFSGGDGVFHRPIYNQTGNDIEDGTFLGAVIHRGILLTGGYTLFGSYVDNDIKFYKRPGDGYADLTLKDTVDNNTWNAQPSEGWLQLYDSFKVPFEPAGPEQILVGDPHQDYTTSGNEGRIQIIDLNPTTLLSTDAVKARVPFTFYGGISNLVVTHSEPANTQIRCLVYDGTNYYTWTGSRWATHAIADSDEGCTVTDLQTNIGSLVDTFGAAQKTIDFIFDLRTLDGVTYPYITSVAFDTDHEGNGAYEREHFSDWEITRLSATQTQFKNVSGVTKIARCSVLTYT